MKFVMHRDRVISSKFGHSIGFKKGEPREVPSLLHAEVIAAGGIPEEELPEPGADGKVPTDPAERAVLIEAAIEALVLRGAREDFSASGAPHNKAVSREVGFQIDARERDAVWTKMQQKTA